MSLLKRALSNSFIATAPLRGRRSVSTGPLNSLLGQSLENVPVKISTRYAPAFELGT